MREFDMYFINNYSAYFSLNYIIILIFLGIVLFSIFKKNSQDIHPIVLFLLFLILILVNYTNFYQFEYINYLLNIDFRKLNLSNSSDKKANIIPIISMITLLVISILISKYIPINNNETKNFVIFMIYLIFGIVKMMIYISQITNNMYKIENYLESKDSSFKQTYTFFQIIFVSLIITLSFISFGFVITRDAHPETIYFIWIGIFFLLYLVLLITNINILKNNEETLSNNIYNFRNPKVNVFL